MPAIPRAVSGGHSAIKNLVAAQFSPHPNAVIIRKPEPASLLKLMLLDNRITEGQVVGSLRVAPVEEIIPGLTKVILIPQPLLSPISLALRYRLLYNTSTEV